MVNRFFGFITAIIILNTNVLAEVGLGSSNQLSVEQYTALVCHKKHTIDRRVDIAYLFNLTESSYPQNEKLETCNQANSCHHAIYAWIYQDDFSKDADQDSIPCEKTCRIPIGYGRKDAENRPIDDCTDLLLDFFYKKTRASNQSLRNRNLTLLSRMLSRAVRIGYNLYYRKMKKEASGRPAPQTPVAAPFPA